MCGLPLTVCERLLPVDDAFSCFNALAGAAISIDAKGWPDVVVWNPHEGMACYKSFCCVENACFKPQSVAPGESWRAETEMDTVDLA